MSADVGPLPSVDRMLADLDNAGWTTADPRVIKAPEFWGEDHLRDQWMRLLDEQTDALPTVEEVALDVVSQWATVPWARLTTLIPADYSWDPQVKP